MQHVRTHKFNKKNVDVVLGFGETKCT